MRSRAGLARRGAFANGGKLASGLASRAGVPRSHAPFKRTCRQEPHNGTPIFLCVLLGVTLDAPGHWKNCYGGGESGYVFFTVRGGFHDDIYIIL